ncbi:hypothetical protein ACOME3_010060 [Neoechinorhynchus agilis]
MNTESVEDGLRSRVHSTWRRQLSSLNQQLTAATREENNSGDLLALQSWRYGHLAFACNFMKYQLYLASPPFNHTRFNVVLGLKRASQIAEGFV